MADPSDSKIVICGTAVANACYNITASLFVSADSCNVGNASP